jgi:hypothetical protein
MRDEGHMEGTLRTTKGTFGNSKAIKLRNTLRKQLEHHQEFYWGRTTEGRNLLNLRKISSPSPLSPTPNLMLDIRT